MSCPYSTSSKFSSSSPSMGFSSSSSSSSSSNSTSTQGVDKSNKNRYQENFDDRHQNIFKIMLQTTPLPEDVAALCTNFTESMEPKNVRDGHQFTSTGDSRTADYVSYSSLMRKQESPLVKAAKNLPDGALNSFILKLGKTSFTKRELIICLEESVIAKKMDNIRFLLDRSNRFNIEEVPQQKKPINTSLLDIINFEELYYLFGLGDQELANYLMENYMSNEKYHENLKAAYVYAILGGNLELVKSLEDKVVIDSWNASGLPVTLLDSAAASGSIEMLEYIVQKFNIDLKKNINNYTNGVPLIFQAVGNPLFKNNHCSMIDYFVQNGADLKIKDKKDRTLFHYAAENPDIEVLKHIRSILPNLSMDEVDTFLGDTPLSCAARRNNFPAVKYIIENEKVSAGSIAIAIRRAADAPNVEILKYLVNHNPNVNTQDQNGDSPVDMIALEGNLELVQFLVSKGSKISARTLRYAAQSDNLALVKYLVGKGASFNALDFQKGNYSREIVEYLRGQQKIKSWNWKTVAYVSLGIIATVSSVAIGFFYRR